MAYPGEDIVPMELTTRLTIVGARSSSSGIILPSQTTAGKL